MLIVFESNSEYKTGILEILNMDNVIEIYINPYQEYTYTPPGNTFNLEATLINSNEHVIILENVDYKVAEKYFFDIINAALDNQKVVILSDEYKEEIFVN